MKDQLVDMLSYHNEANRAYIELFKEHTALNEKTRGLFSHLLNLHGIWNARITGESPAHDAFELHAGSDMDEIQRQNERETERILDIFDLGSPVEYTDSEGASYENSVRQIMTQVINQGTYHRGEVAQLLRSEGLEPPATDYIVLRR